jgi:hypothetical protein
MNQLVFEVRVSPSGKHICTAYIGKQKVGVSRQAYTNGEEAISDVLEQLGQPLAEEPIVYVVSRVAQETG